MEDGYILLLNLPRQSLEGVIMDDIYGELENGLEFLLSPQWLLDWEADEKETFEEVKDGN